MTLTDKRLPRILKCAFFTFALFVFFNTYSYGQQAIKPWHGIQREIRYQPEGSDFVIHNGKRRFNRALYGTNTAFRLETGDLPEFALYLPGMGGNLKFGLIAGDKSKWLINASSVEARYRPGSMIYVIKDTMLGKGTLNIHVLAGATTEGLIVKAWFSNVDSDVKLFWAYGGATGKKFSRDGDIGADPESSFYLQPDYCKNNSYQIGKNAFTLNFNAKSVSEAARYEVDHTGTAAKAEEVTKNTIYGIFPTSEDVHTADAGQQSSPLAMFNSKGDDKPVITGIIKVKNDEPLYWMVQNGKVISNNNISVSFKEAEAKRLQLVSRVQVKTPDAYINTLGGALSVAADGIWESPSYMHGAVAWRMRLNAWRGPYVADPLGWHDRAWSHFSSYALSQFTTPETGPVVADTALHLARQLEKVGTAMFSSGYVSRNPGGGKLVAHHYDMNLVYIDEMLNHFKWTGDLSQVKQMWPVIKRHLAWEKRNFDADGDGLYDAYCAIWASDALQYSGGGVTHSSAYNYRSNKAAAYIAKLIGEDPKPYQQEADKILNSINSKLWMPGSGSYAEYKDLLGLQLVHPSAGLWTVYHAIDSDVPDAFQAYEALRYVDTQIPHIPVTAKGLTGNYYLPATTNWLPYDWSLNNVVMAETMHTALAYWQGNRKEEAFTLWKSALLESMYLGASPGNFQQLSFYDAQRGELYRDFADPIGMTARALVEGLFGIRPDLLKGKLMISPGLPAEWDYASLDIPDVKFDFKRKGYTDTYHITPHFAKAADLIFKVPAHLDNIRSVTVNGRIIKWTALSGAVGEPLLQLNAGRQKDYLIKIIWSGKKPVTDYPLKTYTQMTLQPAEEKVETLQLFDPQNILDDPLHPSQWIGSVNKVLGYHTYFIETKQGKFAWWQPINVNVVKPIEITSIAQNADGLSIKIKDGGVDRNDEVTMNPGLGETYHQFVKIEDDRSATFIVPNKNLLPGSNHIMIKTDDNWGQLDTTIINWQIPFPSPPKTETVDLKPYFNDKVTNIFKNQYLSPRPKSPTLQLPTQGIGNWAYPLVTANIDDSGLKKAAAANNGLFTIPQQIPFATVVGDEKNIIFTSQWDNFPKEISIPLNGQAIHAYLLMAGSTNPMQTRLTNAEVVITYQDGTTAKLAIKNPENWWPIEQDDDNDGYAFNTGAVKPLRVYLKTGEVTQNFKHFTSIKGYSGKGIDGGAGTVLDLPLDPSKKLKSLTLKTLANDVVIGLMSVTLVRE